MAEIPDTQKAWRVVRQGPPSKALASQEIPVPKIREGEVLVKIEAGYYDTPAKLSTDCDTIGSSLESCVSYAAGASELG